MQLAYRLAADAVLVLHISYVSFVLVGFLLTVVGILARWQWIRNFWFRSLHLVAILLVVAESLLGIICPLTTWENELRQLAGQTAYRGDFIAQWLHDLLFFDAEPWVFTVCYTLFGLAVLATFILAPPRWRKKCDHQEMTCPRS
jgi:hypothetical protein